MCRYVEERRAGRPWPPQPSRIWVPQVDATAMVGSFYGLDVEDVDVMMNGGEVRVGVGASATSGADGVGAAGGAGAAEADAAAKMMTEAKAKMSEAEVMEFEAKLEKSYLEAEERKVMDTSGGVRWVGMSGGVVRLVAWTIPVVVNRCD